MRRITKAAMIISGLLALAAVWQFFNPVTIIGTHRVSGDRGTVVILVKNFPITPYGRERWWHQNQQRLAEKDIIPGKGRLIRVIHTGEGYLTSGQADSDAYCFDDIASDKKCVNKNFLMDIEENTRGRIELNSIDYLYIDTDTRDMVIMSLIMLYASFILPVMVILSCLYFAWQSRRKRIKLMFFMFAVLAASPYGVFVYLKLSDMLL